jgi:imidazolonepropionase-like amidohydrolase
MLSFYLGLLGAALTAFLPYPLDEASDVEAARALFERNLQAIRDQDRGAYLACYLESERLVRVGPEGQEHGYVDFAAGLGDTWPDRLASRDLELTWLGPGLVFGTYRYHVVYGGESTHGISERLFQHTDDGWRIALTTAHPQPKGVAAPPLALVGGTALDGTGGVIEDAVVLIRDARIEAIGPLEATSIPVEYEVIDTSGHFLVPGMVDTHVHYSQTGWADGRPDAYDVRDRFPYTEAMSQLEAHPERFHRAFLAHGVTAALDCGGYPWTRAMAQATHADPHSPHVLAAGPLLASWVPSMLHVPDQSQFVLMTNERDVRATVASHAAYGSDVIKVWLVLVDRSLDELEPLIHAAGEAAREHNLPLIVHATQLEAARLAVDAGAQLLVHSIEDTFVDDAFIEACQESGVFYCPTLTVSRGYHRYTDGRLPDELLASLENVSPWIAERVRATPTGRPSHAPTAALRESARALQLHIMSQNLQRLANAGIPVVLGTDAGNPLTLHGASVAEELQAMQNAGLTPDQVLTAATSDAARALGLLDTGRLTPGSKADLLVLDQDPREDIAQLGKPTWILRHGVLHARQDLLTH